MHIIPQGNNKWYTGKVKKVFLACIITGICVIILIRIFSMNNPTPLLTITSSSFQPNEFIPSQFTCDGEGTNPSLAISGIPQGAKTLALVMSDPDAPSGTFYHWIKFNIPVENVPALTIQAGKEPAGISGKGTSGKAGYVPPCPPSGAHHYIFDVYALDAELNLQSGISVDELLSAMKGHILAAGQIVGFYSRIK
jgi:Raf kinase inhibitor-like YbhB/YbcL family protein